MSQINPREDYSTELLPENRTLPEEIIINIDEQQEPDNKLVLTSQIEGCMLGNVTIGVYVLVDKKGSVSVELGNNAGGVRRDPRKTQGALVALDTRTGEQVRLSDIDVKAFGAIIGRINLMNGKTKPVTVGSFDTRYDDQSTIDALQPVINDPNSPIRIVSFSWDGYA